MPPRKSRTSSTTVIPEESGVGEGTPKKRQRAASPPGGSFGQAPGPEDQRPNVKLEVGIAAASPIRADKLVAPHATFDAVPPSIHTEQPEKAEHKGSDPSAHFDLAGYLDGQLACAAEEERKLAWEEREAKWRLNAAIAEVNNAKKMEKVRDREWSEARRLWDAAVEKRKLVEDRKVRLARSIRSRVDGMAQKVEGARKVDRADVEDAELEAEVRVEQEVIDSRAVAQSLQGTGR